MCTYAPACFVTVAVRVVSTDNNDIMNLETRKTLKELGIRKL